MKLGKKKRPKKIDPGQFKLAWQIFNPSNRGQAIPGYFIKLAI